MTSPAPTHSHPPGPVADLRRCPTCNRWGGKRDLDGDGVTVRLHPTEQRGACNEGPWHGSLRGPRNACGQWLPWIMIAAAADAASAQAARTGQSPPSAAPSPAVPSATSASSAPLAA